MLALAVVFAAWAADGAPAVSTTVDPPAFTGKAVRSKCKYVNGTVVEYDVERTITEVRDGAVVDRSVLRRDLALTITWWDAAVAQASILPRKWNVEVPSADPVRRAILLASSLDLREPVRLEFDRETRVATFKGVDEVVRRTQLALRDAEPVIAEAVASLPEAAQAGTNEWMRGFFGEPDLVRGPYESLALVGLGFTCANVESGSFTWVADDDSRTRHEMVVGDPIGKDLPVHVVETYDPTAPGFGVAPLAITLGAAAAPAIRAERPIVSAERHLDMTVSLDEGWPIAWTEERRVMTSTSEFVDRTEVTRME